MRLGMSGAFLPNNMDDFTPEMAKKIRSLGFSGVFTRFRENDPFETPSSKCYRVRDLLADHGLRIYQSTGYWQPLIHPDETQRRQAVRTLQQALKIAGDLGARGIDTGPGSLNPNGPWNPHPNNWSLKSREQLIKSLKESASAAEDNQVYLSLEGHQLVVLEDERVTKIVLDAVDSPWVKSDLDPANWIQLKTIFTTGVAIDQMFDILGEHIISGHAKDITITNSHTLHLPTTSVGQGLLDFRTYLRRMEDLNPDYPLIVEGSSESELPEASAYLYRIADELGIDIIQEIP
ncbi:sugar phosphate isomerase/epimerase [Candidatus Poribacteria bacterium]|nr:sugar phosphate isomerase/epimerase [Candidatus Poribacteria bacterium]|tara:strand:- start:2872 stop:3744 length:873 start_codon:yes stop_codon:yes gene_type:complete